IYCPHVERLAVDWVKKCLPEVPNPSIYQEYKNSQMNMLLYGSRKPSLKRIARIWYNESYDYDYDTNSCKRDCEHYTRSYSYELERLAMQWVAQCRWEHPDPKIYTQYRGIGQNLALYGGYVPTFTKMAEGWYNEVANYTYYNNHCSHVCGHYTQMVWASTTHLGCAMRRCDNIAPHWPKPVYLMACQYAPGGNFYGMRPYDAGQTCSKCPAGYTCYRRQCSKVPHYTKRR
ncbi:unnamed protein product, partial [Mesocestoides corti]